MATLGKAKQIPVIGKSIARVGQVYDIVSQPCTPDPIVMVQALFHDAPKLLWSVFKPDVQDLAVDRAGIRHKKKPKRGFNIFDMLDSSVQMPKGRTGWAMFHLGHMAERIGWYLLIVDATTEFAVNWTSTVYEWSGCDIVGAPFCSAYGIPQYQLYHVGEWQPIPCFTNFQFQAPFLSHAGHFQSPAGYNATFGGSLKWKSVPATGFGVGQFSNIRLVDTANNLYWEMPPAIEGSDGYMQTSFAVRSWELLNPAHDFQFWGTCTETGWFSFDGSFGQLVGHKDKGLLADP